MQGEKTNFRNPSKSCRQRRYWISRKRSNSFKSRMFPSAWHFQWCWKKISSFWGERSIKPLTRRNFFFLRWHFQKLSERIYSILYRTCRLWDYINRNQCVSCCICTTSGQEGKHIFRFICFIEEMVSNMESRSYKNEFWGRSYKSIENIMQDYRRSNNLHKCLASLSYVTKME